MIEKFIVVTNNSLTYENYKNKFEVVYIDGSVENVYIKVRDYVHNGHKLLTHPLISSIKPNETPFRTVLVSKKIEDLDLSSLEIIENSIETHKKFMKMYGSPIWNENAYNDFKLIDFDLINSSL